MTLPEFLLARIAEDEAAASRAGSFTPWTKTFQNDNYGHLIVQPARVLAECEAKRRIVEAFTGPLTVPDDSYFDGLEVAVKTLAAVYADHPDYRDEWRP